MWCQYFDTEFLYNYAMNFAERLRELRKDNQCTQKQLAAFLGLTPNCICEWENLRSEPSLASLLKIAAYFEVSVDYLVGNSDDLGSISIQSEILQTTTQEKELLEYFRELSPYMKGVALDTVRAMTGKPSGRGLQNKA